MSRELNRESSIELLHWEKIEQDISSGKHTYRAAVPGGWILRFINAAYQPQDCDYMFIADPKHLWGTEEKAAS